MFKALLSLLRGHKAGRVGNDDQDLQDRSLKGVRDPETMPVKIKLNVCIASDLPRPETICANVKSS